ncbi:hypothetical protein V8E54_014810 [Elaphomyces granulatus]
MGTCNLICVYHKGRFVIAQYCQWDGYPEGQGRLIYRSAVGEKIISLWPSLLRDTGAKILEIVAQATAEKRVPIVLDLDFDLSCECVMPACGYPAYVYVVKVSWGSRGVCLDFFDIEDIPP